jgi:hypothetical protein
MALGLLGLVAVVAFAVFALRAATDAQHRAQATQLADATAIAKLSTSLDQTRAQLQAHGVTPSAPPATTIVKDVPGAQGQPGASIVGPQGPPGRDGVSPDPTQIAALAASMVHPIPGPSGPPGVAGKDSTVPGPQGPAGANSNVPGPAGPQGAPGQDSTVPGPKGDKGDTGPAPTGWTFTFMGVPYNCTPNSPGSTQYSCQPAPATPPPSPAPSQSATTSKQSAAPRASAPVSTGPGRP